MEIVSTLEKSMQAPSSICVRALDYGDERGAARGKLFPFPGRARFVFVPLRVSAMVPVLLRGCARIFMTPTIARLCRSWDIFFREHIISSGF
ncbi:hypothetical protein [Rhizobium binae]|nr:hypothetical protein [Rhizobium binae]MBX4939950.1 hypothetical protein [Rhizobium binae]